MFRIRALAAWLPALLLVPAGFAVAVHVARPAEPSAVTRELFPLDVGTTWVYAVSDHGEPSGTHTRQVLGDQGLAGLEATLVNAARVGDTWTDYPGYPGPGERRTSSYFAPHGNRIDQYGVISPDHRFQQLDPVATVYELVDDLGDSWTYQGTLDLQDISYTTELAERGPVTIAGHTFQGCSRFVTTISVELPDQPKTEEIQEETTCPGYGPVRSSDRYEPTDLDVTEELTEFHGESGNWYAASPTAPDQGDGTATALGFDPARTNAVADGDVSPELAWTMGREATSDFPPVSAGDVMVTGDVEGLVSATNVSTGEPVWQVQLRPPILVTPAIAGGSVLVADGSKQLRALSMVDGSTRWVHELDDVVSVSPAVSADADTAAVVTDDGRLSVLGMADGKVRWDAGRASRASTAPAVSEGTVYVCDEAGNLTAYDLADGDVAWSRSLADGVLMGPVVAGGRVLAQDDSGAIYAFTTDDGTLQWQSRTRGRGYGFIAATDDSVVSLIAGTSVVVVDAADGSRTWRRSVPFTKVAPVVVGDEVLTVSAKGRIDTFSLADGASIASWELPRPVPEQAPVVDVATALVGDALVITSDPGTSPAWLTHYAYPLHGTGHGLLLGLDPHVVPAATTEPVTAAGGSFYVPGYDGTVTRTGAGGASTELVHNKERLATAPAVADGLAVVRRDDQLQAVPVDGGDPLWSIPAGNAYAGSTPLVAGDTVYAGTSDGRLLAVGLADGKARWTASVDANYLPSTPALLPDGDVVYGVGLGRYDAATGAPVWSAPGVVSYGSPVVAEGIVYAAVDRPDGTRGLGAWDVETGRSLWFSDGVPASYVGPSVADGVVVFVDAFGTVHALDARDGTARWTTELHRPVGGVPVIRDGRVYVTGLGVPEEVRPRDYRVAAYDLQTGQFLASWEPPVIGQWIVPFVGPGEPGEDTVLVPTGLSLEDVLVGVGPVG